MKKNLLYALVACLAFTFAACSDDPLDATSKHVYGPDENPYLKTNTAATISTSQEIPVQRIDVPQEIKLADYAYDRWATDADVVAALANHPNISISK